MTATEAGPAKTRRSLLLVDDEPDILSSIKSLLEMGIEGLDVTTAHSGRAGLEALRSRTFDAIVSDFRMPGMDGIEFLRRCRQERPAVPRVMMTAFATAELAQRAASEAMAALFLSKAEDPALIVKAIASVLGQAPARKRSGPD